MGVYKWHLIYKEKWRANECEKSRIVSIRCLIYLSQKRTDQVRNVEISWNIIPKGMMETCKGINWQ